MTEDDVVRIVRSYIEGLFPKVCPKCGKQFNTLREYLESTTHLGNPHFFESASRSQPVSASPLGPITHATCLCGNTLTIGSEGLPKDLLLELVAWARVESQTRSISTSAVVRQLRDRIDQQVLGTDEAPQERRRIKK